jgi:hypothetical protein
MSKLQEPGTAMPLEQSVQIATLFCMSLFVFIHVAKTLNAAITTAIEYAYIFFMGLFFLFCLFY